MSEPMTLQEVLDRIESGEPFPDPVGIACDIWAGLESLPGFNERIQQGLTELAAGRRVEFES